MLTQNSLSFFLIYRTHQGLLALAFVGDFLETITEVPAYARDLIKRLGMVTTTFSPTDNLSWSPGIVKRRTQSHRGLSSLRPRAQRLAYLSLLVTILDTQSIHGPDDGCQRLDGVAVHDRLVLLYVFSRKAIFMDDPGGKPQTTPHEYSVLT